jgi:hypothetical protein
LIELPADEVFLTGPVIIILGISQINSGTKGRSLLNEKIQWLKIMIVIPIMSCVAKFVKSMMLQLPGKLSVNHDENHNIGLMHTNQQHDVLIFLVKCSCT